MLRIRSLALPVRFYSRITAVSFPGTRPSRVTRSFHRLCCLPAGLSSNGAATHFWDDPQPRYKTQPFSVINQCSRSFSQISAIRQSQIPENGPSSHSATTSPPSTPSTRSAGQVEESLPAENGDLSKQSKGLQGLREIFSYAISDDPHNKRDFIQEPLTPSAVPVQQQVSGKRAINYQAFRTKAFATLGIACAIGAAASEAAIAGLMKNVVDGISPTSSMLNLAIVAGSITAFYAVKAFSMFGQEYSFKSAISVIMAKLRSKAHNHVTSQPAHFFAQHKPSDLTTRLSNDVAHLQRSLRSVSSELILSPLRVGFLVGLIFFRSPFVALVAAVVMPLSVMLVSRMGKKIRKHERKSQELNSEMVARMNESFSSMPFVITYGLRNYIRSRFEQVHNKFLKHQLRVSKYDSIMGPVTELSSAAGVAVVLFVGGIQVVSGTLTTGDLLSFLTALSMLQKPVKKLLSINVEIQSALASWDRIKAILNNDPSKADHSALVRTDVIPRDSAFGVVFRNVDFAYPDRPSRKVLSDISFEIKPGELVLFIGRSGSGKSTVLSLISKLYHPGQGTVLLDDISIDSIKKKNLARRVAFVHQVPVVWHDTVANNVRLGKLDATDEEVISALKLACAWEFIQELSHGIHTDLGQRGLNLSVGQKQRLSLARALVSGAPLLLMDEVTASLDNYNEDIIYNVLTSLKGKRTVLLVTHRLRGIVEKADKIVVMNHGNVVEVGTHSELLRTGSEYRSLVLLSTMEEEEEEEDQEGEPFSASPAPDSSVDQTKSDE